MGLSHARGTGCAFAFLGSIRVRCEIEGRVWVAVNGGILAGTWNTRIEVDEKI